MGIAKCCGASATTGSTAKCCDASATTSSTAKCRGASATAAKCACSYVDQQSSAAAVATTKCAPSHWAVAATKCSHWADPEFSSSGSSVETNAASFATNP